MIAGNWDCFPFLSCQDFFLAWFPDTIYILYIYIYIYIANGLRPVAAPCSRLPLSAVRCGRWRPLAPWRSGAQTEQWWPPFSAWAPSCLRDRFLPQAWRQVPDRPIPRKARRSVSKKGLRQKEYSSFILLSQTWFCRRMTTRKHTDPYGACLRPPKTLPFPPPLRQPEIFKKQ